MGLKLLTPPTVDPISIVGLDRLKEHLHEATDVADEDALITGYLNAAWELAERHTWRQFLTAQWRYTLRSWTAQNPDRSHGRYLACVLIPRPPCQSIDLVEYIDCSGDTQSLTAGTDFEIDDESDVWSIVPAFGKTWPRTRHNHPKAVQITFTAGYGNTADDLPDVLLHAVKLQVGNWFLNREATDTRKHSELPAATKALLESIEVRDDRLVTDIVR